MIMTTGTSVFRIVILIVVVTLASPLCIASMDHRESDQVAVDSSGDSDCPINAGLLDCCTIRPFVAEGKAVASRLALAGSQIAIPSALSLENLYSSGRFAAVVNLPVGDKRPTQVSVSILRI